MKRRQRSTKGGIFKALRRSPLVGADLAIERAPADGRSEGDAPSPAPRRPIRNEYDFSAGVRGKYADQYRRGVNVVLLDPDLTGAFPDSKSVNDALRALLAIAKRAELRKRT